jgi:hypothetical protein
MDRGIIVQIVVSKSLVFSNPGVHLGLENPGVIC